MWTRLGVTLVEAIEIVQVVTAKSRRAWGACCHPAFMSNCWTVSHTYETHVFSRGVAIGLFGLVCEEGDPTIIGKVDMSYFDTLR